MERFCDDKQEEPDANEDERLKYRVNGVGSGVEVRWETREHSQQKPDSDDCELDSDNPGVLACFLDSVLSSLLPSANRGGGRPVAFM